MKYIIIYRTQVITFDKLSQVSAFCWGSDVKELAIYIRFDELTSDLGELQVKLKEKS